MVEIFEKLGFSVQSKSGKSGRILSMTNFDNYLGVSVHFTDEDKIKAYDILWNLIPKEMMIEHLLTKLELE